MPSSGVKIAEEVIGAFSRLKNPPKDLHWIKCALDDKSENIVLIDKLEKSNDFTADDVAAHCKDDEAFYMVIDVKMNDGGRVLEKILFLQWCPDTAPVKKKMLISSSAEDLKAKFNGFGAKLEASDSGDVTPEAIKSAIKSGK